MKRKPKWGIIAIASIAVVAVAVILIIPYLNPSEHSHLFNETIASDVFLVEPANCQSPATYYKSCSCGEAGIETFVSGEKNLLKHANLKKNYTDFNIEQHTVITTCVDCNAELESLQENHNGSDTCTLCNANLHQHVYDQEVQHITYKKNDVSCEEALTYYKSCICGEKGEDIFVIGEALGHDFSKQTTQYLAANANCTFPAKYYLICIRCNEKGNATYVYGEKDLSNHIGDSITTYVFDNDLQHKKITQCSSCCFEKEVTLEDHKTTGGTCYLCESHIHNFVLELSTINFLKSDATCISKSIYYKSCICGTAGTETFESGETNPNNHTTECIVIKGSVANICKQYSKCGAIYEKNHVLSYVGQEMFHQSCTNCDYVISEHTLSEPTCTVSSTCSCGYTVGTPLGHQFSDIPTWNEDHSFASMVCLRNGCISAWGSSTELSDISEGTCINPGTYCHKVKFMDSSIVYTCDEKHIGHINKNNHEGQIEYVGTQNVCSRYNCCGVAINSSHSLTIPTCTTGALCVNCGYVAGLPLGHTFSNPCDDTCNRCPTKRIVYHDFEEATCDSRATCRICGQISGEALGHIITKTINWTPSHSNMIVECSRENCTKTWSGTTTKTIIEEASCRNMEKYKHTLTITVDGIQYKFDCPSVHNGAVNTSKHSGIIVPAKKQYICQWYSCCNTIVQETHDFNEVSCNGTLCARCGYEIPSNVGHVGTYTVTWDEYCKEATITCNTCNLCWIEQPEKVVHEKSTCNKEGKVDYQVRIIFNGETKTIRCPSWHFEPMDPNNHEGNIVYAGTATAHTEYDCCGKVVSTTHSFTTTSNGTKVCVCGYTQETEHQHIWNYYTYGNDRHKKECINCDYSLIASCNYAIYREPSCNNGGEYRCVECAYVKTTPPEHTGLVVYAGTAAAHTKYNCCGLVVSATHSFSIDSLGRKQCVCGYVIEDEECEHIWTYDKKSLTNRHVKHCTLCDVQIIENCVFYDTTTGQKCIYCAGLK